MHYLYHRKPLDMQGDTLYPLNQLQGKYPPLFNTHVKKYDDRHWVMKQRIPLLDDCLWNDVIFMSAVHPQALLDARRMAGFPDMPSQEYYQINPKDLDHAQLAVFLFRPEAKRGQPLTHADFAQYSDDDLPRYSALRYETVRYFNRLHDEGVEKIPLFWRYVPHIMYRGSIDISQTRIIACH